MKTSEKNYRKSTFPKVDWLITQMRIIGGVEKYIYWLACEFAKRGWDIRIITILDDDNLSNQIRQQGISVYSLSAKSKFDIAVWYRLEKTISERKPDILHTHLYHAGILGRLVGRKVGIPIILCHQGGPEVGRSLIRSLLDRGTSHYVTRYLVSCKSVSSILQTRERIDFRKIDLIPNGIQLPLRDVDGRNVKIRVPVFKLPLALVTLGRLVYEKAQDVMIRALHIMAMRNITASLSIIGDGPLKPYLKSLINQLNLSNSVRLIGFQQNPYRWMRQSDIFIWTSLWEGTSLALMEAMALGLPVVATATGGTPELISHLEHGYLIPPNSPEALADAIEYLFKNPKTAHEMAEKAQKHILDNYTIPKVADQLEKYYMGLLKEYCLQ